MRMIDADQINYYKATVTRGMRSFYDIEIAEKFQIDRMPTIDPESLRSHGHWKDFPLVRKINKTNVPIVQCSNCKITFCDIINNHHYIYHYCPYCGAKMEGVEEP